MSEEDCVYPVSFRCGGRGVTLLWSTSASGDYYLTTSQGRLIRQLEPNLAKAEFRDALSGVKWDEATDCDIDDLFQRLDQACATYVLDEEARNLVLVTWNLIEDLLRTKHKCESTEMRPHLGPHKAYQKLFWGNNIPAVTPTGKHYEPIWEPNELAEIRRALDAAWCEVREFALG